GLSGAVPVRGHQPVGGAGDDPPVRDRGRAVLEWIHLGRGGRRSAGPAPAAAVLPPDLSQVRRTLVRGRAAARGRSGRVPPLCHRAGPDRGGAPPGAGRLPLAHGTLRVRRGSPGHRPADGVRPRPPRRRRRPVAAGPAGRRRALRADLRRGTPAGPDRRLRLMRVAIFGGSFNPPHVAHQMAALYVLETAPVDELWLVPAVRHAFGKALAPFADRLAMCERAAAALGPRVRVSAIERELGGESRTLRTVRRLQQDHPADSFSLVIGADLLGEVPSWLGGAELQRTVPFIVVGRGGFSAEAP